MTLLTPIARIAVIAIVTALANFAIGAALLASQIAELARLATSAEGESARVAAIKELLDRAYGKSPQAITGESGEGPATIQIITGVPSCESEVLP